MRNWVIRKAEPLDASGLATCIDAAYAHYARRIEDLPPMSADCAEEIAKFQVWVAEVAGSIVGGLILIAMDGFMLLANVAVHPNHRGVGLGRELLALAEAEAVRQGFSEMRLNTHVDMPENVELYARLGWKRTGQQGNKISMKIEVGSDRSRLTAAD